MNHTFSACNLLQKVEKPFFSPEQQVVLGSNLKQRNTVYHIKLLLQGKTSNIDFQQFCVKWCMHYLTVHLREVSKKCSCSYIFKTYLFIIHVTWDQKGSIKRETCLMYCKVIDNIIICGRMIQCPALFLISFHD